jgi:hypothetical protein
MKGSGAGFRVFVPLGALALVAAIGLSVTDSARELVSGFSQRASDQSLTCRPDGPDIGPGNGSGRVPATFRNRPTGPGSGRRPAEKKALDSECGSSRGFAESRQIAGEVEKVVGGEQFAERIAESRRKEAAAQRGLSGTRTRAATFKASPAILPTLGPIFPDSSR